MKGLLLKDYYLIRDGMVILLLTFVAVGAGLAFLTSPWVLIVVAGATMSFQGAMTVQSDRSTQWDRFSAVLPLPRSTAVSEKYVLYLLLCALGMALGLAVGGIAAVLGRAPDPEELYLYASTAVIVCLMTGSVNLPCTFVLTAEKSLAGIILCDILVSALFAGGKMCIRDRYCGAHAVRAGLRGYGDRRAGQGGAGDAKPQGCACADGHLRT